MRYTRKLFELASRAHLHGADVLSAAKKAPDRLPATVAYLAQVAVECGLKALLLHRAAIVDSTSARDEQKYPRLAPLFHGTSGHALDKLADEAGLSQLMRLAGRDLARDACWQRMTSRDRPYSVRYGAEAPTAAEARAEAARAKEILDVVLGRLSR